MWKRISYGWHQPRAACTEPAPARATPITSRPTHHPAWCPPPPAWLPAWHCARRPPSRPSCRQPAAAAPAPGPRCAAPRAPPAACQQSLPQACRCPPSPGPTPLHGKQACAGSADGVVCEGEGAWAAQSFVTCRSASVASELAAAIIHAQVPLPLRRYCCRPTMALLTFVIKAAKAAPPAAGGRCRVRPIAVGSRPAAQAAQGKVGCQQQRDALLPSDPHCNRRMDPSTLQLHKLRSRTS